MSFQNMPPLPMNMNFPTPSPLPNLPTSIATTAAPPNINSTITSVGKLNISGTGTQEAGDATTAPVTETTPVQPAQPEGAVDSVGA